MLTGQTEGQMQQVGRPFLSPIIGTRETRTVRQSMTTIHALVANAGRSPNLSHSYLIIYCTRLQTWCNHVVLCL